MLEPLPAAAPGVLLTGAPAGAAAGAAVPAMGAAGAPLPNTAGAAAPLGVPAATALPAAVGAAPLPVATAALPGASAAVALPVALPANGAAGTGAAGVGRTVGASLSSCFILLQAATALSSTTTATNGKRFMMRTMPHATTHQQPAGRHATGAHAAPIRNGTAGRCASAPREARRVQAARRQGVGDLHDKSQLQPRWSSHLFEFF